MSGHSKWATTHRKKEIQDAKRGAVFTKLSNSITLAARQGGKDIETNFKLRLAVDKARQRNMPKDNIERAIKKGAGELEGMTVEKVSYEGFGPAKSVFIVEAATDNKNRTAAEMKRLFSKYGGNLVASGGVAWRFKRMAVILISTVDYNEKRDEVELGLIDAGAEDIREGKEYVEILTKFEDSQKIKKEAEKLGLKVESVDLEWLPKEEIEVEGTEREKIEMFMEELDDNSEVRDFYANVILS